MVTQEEFITAFAKAIKEENAAIFAGAGLSRGAGFVNWKDLLRPLASGIHLDVDKEHDLLAVAQYCRNEQSNRNAINQAIVSSFTNGVEINENIEILTRFPIDTYWTTNYDNLLEEGFRKNDRICEVKERSAQLTNTKPNRDVVLYKMHGSASDPAEAVLTKDDYAKYDTIRPFFSSVLQGDLLSKTFLFIGFSFDDPNLDSILRRIHQLLDQNTRTHYCFFKRVSVQDFHCTEDLQYAKIKENLRERDLRRYGIQTVYIDEYSDITEILRRVEFAVLLNKVFISGSAAEYQPPWERSSAERLGYQLAQALVREKFQVTTGFGLGVGSSVVNGALDEIFKSKYKHVDDYLRLRPFPQNINDPLERKKLYTKYRQEMISEAGVAIFMFGNKRQGEQVVVADGCIEEFLIAASLGKIIIPIGSTGHAAKEILEKVKGDLENFEYLTDYIETLSNEKDIGKIITTILAIIKRITP